MSDDEDTVRMTASGRRATTSYNADQYDYGISESDVSESESDEEPVVEELKVESLIARRRLPEFPLHEDGTVNKPEEYEYLIKYAGKSYMNTEWMDHFTIVSGGQYLKGMLSRFIKKWIQEGGDQTIEDARANADNDDEVDYFDPAYVEVDRIIGMRMVDRVEAADHLLDEKYEVPEGSKSTVRIVRRRQFLIKWTSLGYNECTWEWEDDVDDDVKVADFIQANRPPLYAQLDPERVARAERPWEYAKETPEELAAHLTPTMLTNRPNMADVCPGGTISRTYEGGLPSPARALIGRRGGAAGAASRHPLMVLRAATRAASAQRRPNCGEDPSFAWLNALHGMPADWSPVNTLVAAAQEALQRSGTCAFDLGRAVCGAGRVHAFRAWLCGKGPLTDGEEARVKVWLRLLGGLPAGEGDKEAGWSGEVGPDGCPAPLPPSLTASVANLWDTYTPLRLAQRKAYGTRVAGMPMLRQGLATAMARAPHAPEQWEEVTSWPPPKSGVPSAEELEEDMTPADVADAAVPTGFQLFPDGAPAHPRTLPLPAAAGGQGKGYLLPLSQLTPMLTALAASGRPLNATQRAFLGMACAQPAPTVQEVGAQVAAVQADLRHQQAMEAAAKEAAEAAAKAAEAAKATAASAPAPPADAWWKQPRPQAEGDGEPGAGASGPAVDGDGDVVAPAPQTKRQAAAAAAKAAKEAADAGSFLAPPLSAVEEAASRPPDAFPLKVRLRRVSALQGTPSPPGTALSPSSGGALDYTMFGAREPWDATAAVREDQDQAAGAAAAVLGDMVDAIATGLPYATFAGLDAQVYSLDAAPELARVPPTPTSCWAVTSPLPAAVQGTADAFPLKVRLRLAPVSASPPFDTPEGTHLATAGDRPLSAMPVTPAPGHPGLPVTLFAPSADATGTVDEWLPAAHDVGSAAVAAVSGAPAAGAGDAPAQQPLTLRDMGRLTYAFLGGQWAPLAAPVSLLGHALTHAVAPGGTLPPAYASLYTAACQAWLACIHSDASKMFPSSSGVAVHVEPSPSGGGAGVGVELARAAPPPGESMLADPGTRGIGGAGFTVEDIHNLSPTTVRTRRGLRCRFTSRRHASVWVSDRDPSPPQPIQARDPRSIMPYQSSIEYGGGRRLRDYQVQGLNWLISAYHSRRNVILADEMGLGKTAQTVTFLYHLFKAGGLRGPFLIVAPLSTLQHWKREVDAWASGEMYGVVYHASGAGPSGQRGKDLRAFIRQWDWFYQGYATNVLKAHVIITTYEVAISDEEYLKAVPWRAVVVDEGHRLRGAASRIKEVMLELSTGFRLLLTGTPLQNNTRELWSLLHWLEPDKFGEEEQWNAAYGNLTSKDQVSRLQADIAPHILRRVKEDVEKSIPKKEETIIDVSLTMLQKQYYRAIFEKNRVFLYRGCDKSNVPALTNIEIQLRKCCNHPYLIQGVEEKDQRLVEDDVKAAAEKAAAEVTAQGSDATMTAEEAGHYAAAQKRMERLVASSGKLVLLDKLLPKLKAEGHKVLIFSQMVRMLDILEDYCRSRRFLYERLDGSVHGSTRQAAIDRFQNDDSRFVFLLSTRAGGVGINLTAADTVIIFDSDWNPQNDIQATARAHRIGQTNEVKVYRLLTRNTYEAKMFDKASRKLALDQAVLGAGGPGAAAAGASMSRKKGGRPALSPQELEALLRHGAYGILAGDEAEDEESRQFQESSIDELLARNTRTIELDASSGKQSGVFKTSFTLDEAKGEGALDMNADDFWEKVLPGFQSATKLLGRLNGVAEASPAVPGKKRGRKKKATIGAGTAVVSEESRAAFMDDVAELVQGLVKSRDEEKGEGGVGAMIESELSTTRRLLVQISAMASTFSEEHRARAAALSEQLSVQRSRTQVFRDYGDADDVLGGRKRRRDKDDFLGSDISDSSSDEEGVDEGDEEADVSKAASKPAKKPTKSVSVPRVPFGFTVPEFDPESGGADAGARAGSAIAPKALEAKRLKFWELLPQVLEAEIKAGNMRKGDIKWAPVIGGRPLDLWQLWKEVARFNGFERACKTTGSWLSMFKRLPNYATSETSSTYRLRSLFQKYLLAMEKAHPPVYEDYKGLGKYKYSRTAYSTVMEAAVAARRAEMETASSKGKGKGKGRGKGKGKKKGGAASLEPEKADPNSPDPVDEGWDDDAAWETVTAADGTTTRRRVPLSCALCHNAFVVKGVERRIHEWRVAQGLETPETPVAEDDGSYDEDTGMFLPPFLVTEDDDDDDEGEGKGAAKARVFVHKHCAEASPEVFQNEKKEYCGVLSAVRRGREIKCAGCKLSGATIGCHVRRCGRSFHLKCAMYSGRHGWRFGVQEDSEAGTLRAVKKFAEARDGPLPVPPFVMEAREAAAKAEAAEAAKKAAKDPPPSPSPSPSPSPAPGTLPAAFGQGGVLAGAMPPPASVPTGVPPPSPLRVLPGVASLGAMPPPSAASGAGAGPPVPPSGGAASVGGESRKRPRTPAPPAVDDDDHSDTESIVGTIEYYAGETADSRRFLCPHHRADQLARLAEKYAIVLAKAEAKEAWAQSFVKAERQAELEGKAVAPYHSKVRVRITGKWKDYSVAVGAALVRWEDWDATEQVEVPGRGAHSLQLVTAGEAVHPARISPDGKVQEADEGELAVDENKARLRHRRVVLKAFRQEALGLPGAETPAKRARKTPKKKADTDASTAASQASGDADDGSATPSTTATDMHASATPMSPLAPSPTPSPTPAGPVPLAQTAGSSLPGLTPAAPGAQPGLSAVPGVPPSASAAPAASSEPAQTTSSPPPAAVAPAPAGSLHL